MLTIKNKTARNILRVAIPFVCIPVLAVWGGSLFGESNYMLVAVFAAVFSFLLFIAGFEQKKNGTRRLVVIAVMTALSIVGRFIPFFKPITAITVITAMYLGSESGFLVGSLSALLSNFYFGQGPWTVFQMQTWGVIGLIAGFIATPLKKSKILLLVYGVISGILYSAVMDIWTVIWYNGGFNLELYLATFTASVPYTVLYAVSNFFFLLIFAKPFGDKLNRLKIKYGV